MTREYNSKELSQPPRLVLPAERARRCKQADLCRSPRNPLGATSIKEFRKTAQAVSEHPWELLRAQAWLLKLCEDNEKMLAPEPFPQNFIFEYQMACTLRFSVFNYSVHSAGPGTWQWVDYGNGFGHGVWRTYGHMELWTLPGQRDKGQGTGIVSNSHQIWHKWPSWAQVAQVGTHRAYFEPKLDEVGFKLA